MASTTFVLLSIIFGLIAYIYWNIKGPSYSEPVENLVPWPVFNIGTRVNDVFHNAIINGNPGVLLHLHHGISYTAPFSLYVVAKLNVADVIHNGTADYRDIATKVGAVPDKLYRIIRYLSSEGVFLLDGNQVKLTGSGEYLRTDMENSMKWCYIHWGEETAESMHKLYHEVKTGEEAFEATFGMSIFSLYEQRPASAEAFTKCMHGIFAQANKASSAEYDFSKHKVLLDLGGGMGHLTKAILDVHSLSKKPSSKISKAIVFDLEKVVKYGEIKHPLLEYRAGSFFELDTIPDGADLILINGVLHDWNDEEAILILTNAAKKLAAGGRIIVSDSFVPSKKGHPMFNTIGRLDVFMMTVSSGMYRNELEYGELFSKADLKLLESRPTRSLGTLWILAKSV